MEYNDWTPGKWFVPTEEQLAQLRYLIEVEHLQQRLVAERLNWPLRRVEKFVKRLHLKTQGVGPRRGVGHPEWKGGRIVDKNGYILVYDPGNPMCRGRYVLEHRKVMADHLGRLLTPKEVVHHKNRDKTDNRLENLELFGSNGLHLIAELTGHVPQWTPEGFARMGYRKGGAKSRRRKERDASVPRKMTPHSITHAGTTTHDPFETEPPPEQPPTHNHPTPTHATAHVSDQPADTDP